MDCSFELTSVCPRSVAYKFVSSKFGTSIVCMKMHVLHAINNLVRTYSKIYIWLSKSVRRITRLFWKQRESVLYTDTSSCFEHKAMRTQITHIAIVNLLMGTNNQTYHLTPLTHFIVCTNGILWSYFTEYIKLPGAHCNQQTQVFHTKEFKNKKILIQFLFCEMSVGPWCYFVVGRQMVKSTAEIIHQKGLEKLLQFSVLIQTVRSKWPPANKGTISVKHKRRKPQRVTAAQRKTNINTSCKWSFALIKHLWHDNLRLAMAFQLNQ